MGDNTWMSTMHTWLQRHAGIVSIAQLVDWGCSRRTAYRLVENGEFEVIMPGVLRSRHWPRGREQLMIAACVRNPRAVICSLTAAKEWKLRGAHDNGDVHVLVPARCSPLMPDVIVHRCSKIDPVDIVKRDDGTRITSPTRTLFDCADLIGVNKAVSVLEQLIDGNRGNFATHAATVARLAGRNRSGTRTMQRVIESRPAWRAAMQSALEVAVLGEIERNGLPAPEVQLRYKLPGGGEVRLDFAWPAWKVALEVDHPYWHAGADASHRDKHRDRKMATVGWQTVRLTDLDVNGGLPASIRDLATILALRTPR